MVKKKSLGERAEAVLERFEKAQSSLSQWENHWQECYDYVLPHRGSFNGQVAGEKKTDLIYDGTAPDAADQLAATMLAQLTPPWTRWINLTPGNEVQDEELEERSRQLEDVAGVIQTHLERSNFMVEIHQCYLDLVIAGTACLLFEEAPIGEQSAFQFTAIPLSEVVMEEGANGSLDTTFRRYELSRAHLVQKFPDAKFPDEIAQAEDRFGDDKYVVIEAVVPNKTDYDYLAILEGHQGEDGRPLVLKNGNFSVSPFINFRWMKAPGESYGRSPVMKALPDIKTANKVVELVLKNASIAVAGMWQAEEDGVINPANIKLAPGVIVPKAMGSSGLSPLVSPGRFDISELVLSDMRQRIRSALMAGVLAEGATSRMTATEVTARTAEAARIMGATFGRLQSELLFPLVKRSVQVLSRRGEIKKMRLDGRAVAVSYDSPMARANGQSQVTQIQSLLHTMGMLGVGAQELMDSGRIVRWLSKRLGIPADFIREDFAQQPSADEQALLQQQAAAAQAEAAQAPAQNSPMSPGDFQEFFSRAIQGAAETTGMDPEKLMLLAQQMGANGQIPGMQPGMMPGMAMQQPQGMMPQSAPGMPGIQGMVGDPSVILQRASAAALDPSVNMPQGEPIPQEMGGMTHG